jgi:uncharacterized protein YcfL
LDSYFKLALFVFLILAGCIATEPAEKLQEQALSVPSSSVPEITATPVVQPSATVQEQYEKAPLQKNFSEAVEVDYRKYVDWFMSYNLNIRGYTPDEYVCGQYTVDMINASLKAGFKSYFGAIRFSDDTAHALVAFKSTQFGYTSWFFFEPQTNNQMTPQTISQNLQEKMGKKVTEVTVYGYYDDAGDKDPTTWRFAYPLYNKKY